MKTEDYIREAAELRLKIKLAKDAIGELSQGYYNSMPHFSIGEKVKIISPAFINTHWRTGEKTEIPERYRYAFICGYQVIESTGKIEYSFLKCKKDGTKSQQRDYIEPIDNIQSI